MTRYTVLILLFFSAISSAQNKVGIFDAHLDVGNCAMNGTSEYNPENQTYTLSGSGSNMWFGKDEFQYLWTTLQGDFILRAEVAFVGQGVDPHRKVGWIIKNSLDANSKHVNATTHGDGLTALQYRSQIGQDTEEVVAPSSAPDVIQLERRGQKYIMSTAKFGEEFTVVELNDMELDNEVYVGIYVCSHNPEVLEQAVYRNVRIIRPVDPDYIPLCEVCNFVPASEPYAYRKLIFLAALRLSIITFLYRLPVKTSIQSIMVNVT